MAYKTMTSVLSLDPDYLESLATEHCEAYSQAQPFPHVVIDEFLPVDILERILEEFPQPNSLDWQQFRNASEKKLASKSERQMGEMTRLLLYQMNSSIFISFLEKLTGIRGIIPDPHFVGGRLHQIEKGGYLKMHIDFNRHTQLRLDRRLNLLLYLNKNWEEEYGGYLEVWDREVATCEKRFCLFLIDALFSAQLIFRIMVILNL